MKKFLLALIITCACFTANATHIIGGEMRYEYVGPGVASNSKQYRIRLLLLRGPTGATFISQYIVGIFNNDNNVKVLGPAENQNWAAVEDFFSPLAVPINISPCIQFPPSLSYTYKTYSFLVELPNNNRGYTVAFQTYSRQTSNNVNVDQGANYLCVIPGLNNLPPPQTDNSPQFKLPVSVICANSNFSLDFSATDPDPTDSLVYSFCNAFNGGLATQADFRDPAAPPYQSVNYTNPFSALNPLGPLVTINSNTGIISGTAPDGGRYVVCVCVTVYRNGVAFATHRKDLIVEVSGCIPTQAYAMPSFTTCDGFNIQFDHSSTGANSVFWDFGDPSTDADTSVLDNPVYVYPDTGIYTIKLIINKGGNCTDSTTMTIGVYPGFFPGFMAMAPFCTGVPIQFTDTSNTSYGVVNSWSWNFGDGTVLSDSSHQEDPLYAYPAPGTYNTTLIVTNSKGCIDTITNPVTVLPSPILNLLSQDTTYCRLDSLQLAATGTGNFTWTPGTNIINANTATPTVFPSTPTTYQVVLNNQGCTSKDSVRLTPLNDLSNSVTATPAAVCEGDTVSLKGFSNKTQGLSWQWTPAATLQTPAQQNTQAYPMATTTYTLRTTWGKNCVVTKNVNVPVTPLAVPNAGPDTSFCEGQTGIQLLASGGNTYSWTPTTGLSNPNIVNPIATPSSTTTYIVQVGVNGCSKTRPDTLLVTIRQSEPVDLLNDTLICVIDTLQLNVPQQGSYLWSPNYMISNTTVANPKVSPDVPTLYRLKFTSIFGCITNDSVFVNVKTQVTLNAGNDTTICLNDRFQLRTSGDALTYNWTPSIYLDNDSIKNPFCQPLQTTTYNVTGNIGKCEAQSAVTVKVVPAPAANAGADAAICFGKDVQLLATGGSQYTWSPGIFLSNTQIPNPVVQRPLVSRQYIVTISDTLGCPKVVTDTVNIMVIPLLHVNAGPADTSIVEDEVLMLNATGALNYQWSPNTWLNNAAIANPVARPLSAITYTVLGTDANGCEGSDSIRIRIFKIDPNMYVPTAFTPNGDGLNDLARPVMIGMKSLTYFKIFNRFGNLVYSTTEIGKGWDGVYKGKAQATATFVWMAEGVTYKNEVRKKKGYVILIR